MNPSIVWIEWEDAIANAGWTCETVAPTHNISVGFIVQETDDYLEVACTYAPDTEMWTSSISVPKNNITKRDTLHLGWGPNAS